MALQAKNTSTFLYHPFLCSIYRQCSAIQSKYLLMFNKNAPD